MDFQGRHIVVTGGAGALGTAVVSGLVEAGAVCHVPCFNEAEAKRFALRDNKQVSRRYGRRSRLPAALPSGRCATPAWPRCGGRST
jgi:NAD(P)-dependent dehydrogenase (short-subunit alcohol dehydrogenase family)